MKKALALLMVVGLSATAFGQGELIFDHYNVGNPSNSGPILLPGGTEGVTGTGYSGQLYGGPDSASLNPALIGGTSDPAVYSFYGAARAGYLRTDGVTVTIPGVEPNSVAQLQINVWNNSNGALTDWSSAEGVATEWGSSDIVASSPLGGPNPDPTLPSIAAPGLPSVPSFTLQVVPEPTTWALLGIGALAMFFRRRK